MRIACILVFSVALLLHLCFSIDWCQKNLDCEFPNGTKIIMLKNTVCDKVEHESLNHCQYMVKRAESAVNSTLLAMHNTFRDQIAKGDVSGWPAASDMRQLTWDESLAEQALRWAFQCDDKVGDPCKTHPVYAEDEGQNLGVVLQASPSSPAPGLVDVFRQWILESQKASPSIVDGATAGDYMDFAEIIYSRASKVGCGVIDYDDVGGRRAMRIVCNYDQEYSLTEPLYTKGADCSCPGDTSCKPDSTYKKLCAFASDPIDEAPVVIELDDTTTKRTMESENQTNFDVPTMPSSGSSRNPSIHQRVTTGRGVPQDATRRAMSSQEAHRSCLPFTYPLLVIPFQYLSKR